MGNYYSTLRNGILTCLRRNLDVDETDSGSSISINCACFHSKTVKNQHEEKLSTQEKAEKHVHFKI